MRDLDNRDLIAGDFLLVSGDVVSNMNLEPALAEHRARREKDKNAIMTMVLRKAGTKHRSKRRDVAPVFVIDPEAQRCLHYEELGGKRGHRKHIRLDSEFISSQHKIEVHKDLIDCHIDICTPDVLAQWSENFDYQSLRTSFLFGVLKDYELNGKTIHTHIVFHQYAARVEDLKSYDLTSQDISGRWTFPMCPDSNLVLGQKYSLNTDKTYREKRVSLGRTSVVKKRSVLGADAMIDERSVVSKSTVGRRCRIGKDVRIEGAHLWDDVNIMDGSTIRNSVIAEKVEVGKNCSITTDSLVSQGVRTPPHAMYSRKLVRRGGDVSDHLTHETNELDASSDTSSNKLYHHTSASSSESSISTIASSSIDFESRIGSRRGSVRSERSDEAGQNRDFLLEATASILDGLQKGDAVDTIFLELNGYRMSVDASQHDVRQAIVSAFLKRTFTLAEKTSPRQAVRQVFLVHKALLQRVFLDVAADKKTDQIDFLLLVQGGVVGRPDGGQFLLFVTRDLYEQEVLEEDGVLQWWNDARSSEGEMMTVRNLTEPFVTFLIEAEEADETDEEEEDEQSESE